MLDKLTLRTVAKISQRVQRESTGYYCGYTFKGQVIGRNYLLKAAQSLDYFTETLEEKTPAQRMHHVTIAGEERVEEVKTIDHAMVFGRVIPA